MSWLQIRIVLHSYLNNSPPDAVHIGGLTLHQIRAIVPYGHLLSLKITHLYLLPRRLGQRDRNNACCGPMHALRLPHRNRNIRMTYDIRVEQKPWRSKSSIQCRVHIGVHYASRVSSVVTQSTRTRPVRTIPTDADLAPTSPRRPSGGRWVRSHQLG